MDPGEVFEAEGHLDAEERLRRNGGIRSARAVRRGEANVIAATGGFDKRLAETEASEESPMLGHNQDAGDGGAGDDDDKSFVDKEFRSLPWHKKPSIYWLLPSFGLIAMAYGGVMVPKINMILLRICKDHMADRAIHDPQHSDLYPPVMFGKDNPQCESKEISALVSRFQLYAQLITGLLSAIISPKLGAMSDRYGRNRLIALCSTGTFLGEVVTILVAQFPDTFSVNWMFLSFALDGMSGSFTAAMALIHSYATDCTPPSQRSKSFGYFHACLFTGMALGPVFAALMIKATGTRLSIFYIALGVHVAFVLFVLFILPESLSKSRQRIAREKYRQEQEGYGIASDWAQYLHSINLFQPLKILFPTGEGSSPQLRRNLIILGAIDTVIFGVAMSMMTVMIIYVKMQFGWGDIESSTFMSIVSGTRVLALLILLPVLVRLFRGSKATQSKISQHGADLLDLYVIRFGILFDAVGLLGYALARSGTVFTLSGMVASVGGIASPTLQSAMTKHVPADRTGQLLGATGLLHALARVGGPVIFMGLYSLTVKEFPQTTFFTLAAVFGLAVISAWFVRPHVYLEEPQPEGVITPPPEYTDEVGTATP